MSYNKLVYFIIVLVFMCLLSYCNSSRPREPYYGKIIGKLEGDNLNGIVFAVDEETVYINNFNYGGNENKNYFAISQKGSIDDAKFLLNTNICDSVQCPLKSVTNVDVLLQFPPEYTLKNVRALMISNITEDSASIYIPEDIDVPKRRTLPEFSRKAHSLRSGNITILDARTFQIPDLYYDGKGPDAYFWVGNGSVNEKGIRIPDEKNLIRPLKKYSGETIIIQLPHYLTVYDIEYLAMWCVQFKHNFGEVFIPKDLDVPPALGQHTPKTVPKSETKTKEIIKEVIKVDPTTCKSGSINIFPSNLLYFLVMYILFRYM